MKKPTGDADDKRADRAALTRTRMLEAAIEIFGSRGFEGTTTRMVVERAGTQLTAISYHFTNKEGLYQAAAGHIAQGIGSSFSAQIERTQQLIHLRLERPELVKLASQLLEALAERLVGPDIPESWSRFLSREMAEPTDSFPVLFGAINQFAGCLCLIVGKLRKKAPDHPDTVLCMLTLVGQVLMFRSNRAAALSFLHWKHFGREEMRAIKSIIRRNVKAILAG